MSDMKKAARPYGTLFAMALVVAVIGRVGLGIMAASGALAFDYISASGVAMLDVVCSILTGSAFVAFMFAAGLALVVSTAGVALYGYLYARGIAGGEAGDSDAGDGEAAGALGVGKPASAFLWGWATALVSIVCLGVVASGILSAVQVGSMSSKLPGTLVLLVAIIGFAAFLGTLLGAASQVVCACVARSYAGHGLGASLVAACALCGVVVMVLTVGTFSAINQVSVDGAVVGAWLVADVVVNLAILALATRKLSKE